MISLLVFRLRSIVFVCDRYEVSSSIIYCKDLVCVTLRTLVRTKEWILMSEQQEKRQEMANKLEKTVEKSGEKLTTGNADADLEPAMSTPAHVKQALKRPIKTALHQAVLDGRLHQVRLLVSKHKVNIDSKDINGRTPVMLCCLLEDERHGLKMAKIFIKAGAFLNVKDNFGRTALSYACMKGRDEIVQRILREDILGVNDKDNDGNTPLVHAATSGNPHCVRLVVQILERFGLPIDVRNNLGYTALLLACKHGHYVSAHILLVEGQASPKIRDNEFFMNASDWARRSHAMQTYALKHRPHTIHVSHFSPRSPRADTSFGREHTMYRQGLASTCKHIKVPQDVANSSYDSSVRLPALFDTSANRDTSEEAMLDGKDARQSLLDTIEQMHSVSISGTPPPIPRPSSTLTTKTTKTKSTNFSSSTRSSHPSTAKLLQFTRRSHRTMNPSLMTIFKLYSDQYSLVERPEDNGGIMGSYVLKDPGISIEIDHPEPSVRFEPKTMVDVM